MQVTNRTTEAIIAFVWHKQRGYGEDVIIKPGETKKVSGPYLGEMDGGKCYVIFDGEIICHSGPDDDTGYQVIPGKLLNLNSMDRGVTVRHHLDEPESHVVQWREGLVVCTPDPDKKEWEVREPLKTVVSTPTLSASYCLDVVTGYSEDDREKLINYLRQIGGHFGITKVQRGMWETTKILRVQTPKATELGQYLNENLEGADDWDCVIHDTREDAWRSMQWLPDYDTHHGFKEFDLSDVQQK